MRRLSDGDAAEGLTDGVAELLGRRLLRGGPDKKAGSGNHLHAATAC